MQRDTDVGGFLGQTFDLIGRNAREIAIYVIVLGAANAFGLIFGFVDDSDTFSSLGFDFEYTSAMGFGAALYQFGVAVLSVVASYLLLQSILANSGRLRETTTRIWAYVGMVILAFLGMAIGFMLLIVPGIILAVRWSASSGFLIGARKGITESLSASWDATRGHSWPIFFAGLILGIGLAIISAVLVGSLTFAGTSVVVASIASLIDAASNALFLVFGLAVYMLVHDDSEHTAEVFS